MGTQALSCFSQVHPDHNPRRSRLLRLRATCYLLTHAFTRALEAANAAFALQATHDNAWLRCRVLLRAAERAGGAGVAARKARAQAWLDADKALEQAVAL